jgi:hypothetical protein
MDRMTHDSDDRFDAWVREASASYNAPPPSSKVPREEMWRRIAAERLAARQTHSWSRFTRGPWTLAAAAALLLAVGIGIGRMTQPDMPASGVASASAPDTGLPGTYDIASARHLTNAEAFVTAVRMSAETPGDTAIQRWARELLTDTRLLLDSPAGSDARRRALLQDLELLLVQVMQLEDARTGDTKERLFDTTQQDQLLTRLRANVPAGPPARS